MRLEFPNGVHGEPVITVGQEVVEAMNGLYKQCMIVNVLGRHVTVESFNRKLRELWKPTGGMCVVDLPRQFFMVMFDAEEDYLAAMTGGPWRVLGSILMVKAWSPEFDPLCDDIVTTPVWVRISHIPVIFYHRAILMGFDEGLGKPLRVDMTTLKMERARFVRVCVEVNLRDPLKGSLLINGERYHVSYEGLTHICPTCGVYGHMVSGCPKRVIMPQIPRSSQEVDTRQSSGERDDQGFTEARGRSRRVVNKPVGSVTGSLSAQVPVQDKIDIASGGVVGVIDTSNRFSGLERELGVKEMTDEVGMSEANKENENNPNVVRQGDLRRITGTGAWDKSGFRERGVEKRIGGTKGIRHASAKGKNLRRNVPMRGLVFGPTKGEMITETSGK
ncbi:hypothetical protein CARUB_v10015332mg, partial [Capsella rubella]